MHPEDIRHSAAGSACFEKCPVVVPVDDFDLGRDSGFRGPFVHDLLKTCLLVGIPDIDRQAVGGSCSGVAVPGGAGGAGTAAAGCEGQGHHACHRQCHEFFHHNSFSFLIMMRRSHGNQCFSRWYFNRCFQKILFRQMLFCEMIIRFHGFPDPFGLTDPLSRICGFSGTYPMELRFFRQNAMK